MVIQLAMSALNIVRGLQFLTLTLSDITFAANQVCQYMHCPRTTHLQTAKRILRFLKGTLNHGLTFHFSRDLSIQAYFDADWPGDPDDRRSTTGSCIFIGPNLDSWGSKK